MLSDPSAQLGLAGAAGDPSHWGYNSSYASYAGFNSSALAHYGSASAVASAVVSAVAATGANGTDGQGLGAADPNAQIPTGKSPLVKKASLGLLMLLNVPL